MQGPVYVQARHFEQLPSGKARSSLSHCADSGSFNKKQKNKWSLSFQWSFRTGHYAAVNARHAEDAWQALNGSSCTYYLLSRHDSYG